MDKLEKIVLLDLPNSKAEKNFPHVIERNNTGGYAEYEIEFLLLEIRSGLPPTNCIFKLQYNKKQNNEVHYLNIHLMKYRKDFIFENGLYILYLDKVKEFPEYYNPYSVYFENERDDKSSATLIYKIKFLEPVHRR